MAGIRFLIGKWESSYGFNLALFWMAILENFSYINSVLDTSIAMKNNTTLQNLVQTLRVNKLRSGNPFLIYSKALPSRHAYLEFPEGRIVIVTVKSGDTDFTTIRELTPEESKAVRTEFSLELVSKIA